MSNTESKKHKHLTLDERTTIQTGLNTNMTFSEIGRLINKDRSTISKEVTKHSSVSDSSLNIINDKTVKSECPLLQKPPYVCNGCRYRHKKCKYIKVLYNAKHAQKAYETLLSESREGIPLQKEAFYRADAIIYDAIKKGQRIYHISQTYNLGMSLSTIYRHLHRGYLSVSKLDFPRIVKFKPRKEKLFEYIPKGLKIGRTYDDFTQFITDNNITQWVEMDTVIGTIGGKTILTFDFTFCDFMIGLLLDDKTSEQVCRKIKMLKQCLIKHQMSFGQIFPLILTDNGGEFSNVYAIENDENGNRETQLFFCDPNKSYQKPHVEKTHTNFRNIVPGGKSFDKFTQETVNLIFSHVNSTKRKRLNGRTPYELFTFIYGTELADVLGIKKINPEDVIQSPALLKSIKIN